VVKRERARFQILGGRHAFEEFRTSEKKKIRSTRRLKPREWHNGRRANERALKKKLASQEGSTRERRRHRKTDIRERTQGAMGGRNPIFLRTSAQGKENKTTWGGKKEGKRGMLCAEVAHSFCDRSRQTEQANRRGAKTYLLIAKEREKPT